MGGLHLWKFSTENLCFVRKWTALEISIISICRSELTSSLKVDRVIRSGEVQGHSAGGIRRLSGSSGKAEMLARPEHHTNSIVKVDPSAARLDLIQSQTPWSGSAYEV
jgi:hypothetical protein